MIFVSHGHSQFLVLDCYTNLQTSCFDGGTTQESAQELGTEGEGHESHPEGNKKKSFTCLGGAVFKSGRYRVHISILASTQSSF